MFIAPSTVTSTYTFTCKAMSPNEYAAVIKLSHSDYRTLPVINEQQTIADEARMSVSSV